MWHYLAKLGRSDLSRASLHLFAFTTAGGYLLFHGQGHTLVRDLLAVELEQNKKKTISQELQSFIANVYGQVESSLNTENKRQNYVAYKSPPIKWFLSTTLDPIVVGTIKMAGVIIGIPDSYEFKSASDVPATFRTFKLFKTKESEEKAKEDDIVNNERAVDTSFPAVTIDKTSEHWRAYSESMILSEDAKRFSIARELFYGDSYRVVFIAGVMVFSTYLSLFLSRAMISRLRVIDAHLTQRVPFYLLGGIAGYGNFCYLSDAINHQCIKTSDNRAMSIGEPYRQGAIEYFSKLLQRNKALRNLNEVTQLVYDEDGNVTNPFLRVKHLPITERLDAARKGPQKSFIGSLFPSK